MVINYLAQLGGKRVGIIGLGNIGSLIARRLEAFGCVISYNSRGPKGGSAARYAYFPDVRGLAAASDVLVVACALTEETRHVVDREALEALGKDGMLVNIGRGAHVDQATSRSWSRRSRRGGSPAPASTSSRTSPRCRPSSSPWTTWCSPLTPRS